MKVIRANSTKQFTPGNIITWKESSQWSGSIMERKGIVQSISKAQSGCYFVHLDNDRTICLEILN